MKTLFCVIFSVSLVINFQSSSAIDIGNALDSLLNAEDVFGSTSVGRQARFYSASETEEKNATTLIALLETVLEDEERLNSIYNRYTKRYKNTGPGEEKGKLIFKKKIIEIAQHNARAKEGLTLYEKGINQFSDTDLDELVETIPIPATPEIFPSSRKGRGYGYSSYSSSRRHTPWFPFHFTSTNTQQDSSSFDWRDFGAISSIKDQGRCGSCSFFATVAALESHSYLVQLASGKLQQGQWAFQPQQVDLSEQELLDCAKNYSGYRGCNNNLPETALEYMKDNGLSQEREYPYRSLVNDYCYKGWTNSKNRGRLDAYQRVLPLYDEEKIREAVRNYGPVMVGLYLGDDLKNYKRGIYDTPCRDPHGISHNIFRNHMALIVGYGAERVPATGENVEFWIMKNSYSNFWGEQGYFRIRRGKRLCLIGEEAYYLYSYPPYKGGNGL